MLKGETREACTEHISVNKLKVNVKNIYCISLSHNQQTWHPKTVHREMYIHWEVAL